MTTPRTGLIAPLLLMMTSLGAGTAQVKAVTIAEKNAARALVVVAEGASRPERHAAAELASFLGQVTGAAFPVVKTAQAGKASLFVGAGAARMADPAFSTEGLGDEGIVIRTVGDDLILAGGEPRGTLYAVYSFLEDYVGCHWWTPAASTIPKKANLSFQNLNVRYVPPLEYRDTNSTIAVEANYSVRNKFNGHHHRLFHDDGLSNTQQDLDRGGRKYAYVKSDRWGAHGLSILAPPQVYFNDHPEWYSLINGKRTAEDWHHSSLCLTNAELRQRVVENSILAMWGHPHATLLSLEQWDDAGPPDHCQCPQCAAVEQEEGSAAGIMVRFTNDVMKDFRAQAAKFEKGPPAVSILAYHYTQKPPLTKPDPDVIVRLCPIHADYSVLMSDDRNSKFRDDFLGWAKLTNRLYIWYYANNFGYPMLPNPNLRTLGPNIRYLVNNSVKGMFAEADPTFPRGGDLTELRMWMLGKLYWNPSLDGRKLIEEFANGYYGPGGPGIVAYINTMHDSLEASGAPLTIDMPPDAKFLNFGALSKGWGHLKAAEAAAAKDPAFLSRVQDAQISVRYAFIMNWDKLRQEAEAAKAPWPFPGTRKENLDQFVEDAVNKRGADPTWLRLPVL